MSRIIYYVAISLDGYIAGPNEDISLFVNSGDGVDRYLEDLKAFETVIMGRKTYEFGYQFGLQAGQPAYPHMEHYIFSNTLSFDHPHPSVHVQSLSVNNINAIRKQAKTDVYLCGGGDLAGWLLEREQIDLLKVKINPIILGGGTRIFGNSKKVVNWKLLDHKVYENGLQIVSYHRPNYTMLPNQDE